LPFHKLDRLADERTFGITALAFDPSDDLLAEGVPLVVRHVRLASIAFIK